MAQRSLPLGEVHLLLEVVTAWIDRAVRRPRTLHHAGRGVCVVDGEVLRPCSRAK